MGGGGGGGGGGCGCGCVGATGPIHTHTRTHTHTPHATIPKHTAHKPTPTPTHRFKRRIQAGLVPVLKAGVVDVVVRLQRLKISPPSHPPGFSNQHGGLSLFFDELTC